MQDGYRSWFCAKTERHNMSLGGYASASPWLLPVVDNISISAGPAQYPSQPAMIGISRVVTTIMTSIGNQPARNMSVNL